MKITDTESIRAGQIAPVAGTNTVAPAAPAAPGGGATPAASLELSPQAQAKAAAKAEAAQFVPTVNAVPDRADQIADLRSRIAAGTYHVSAQDIAGQIINRAQADRVR